jgi:transketolase
VEKWRAFGWHALEVDGHRMEELLAAVDEARGVKGKPTAIVAHTVKGKGVSFMEGQHAFHGKAPDDAQLAEAIKELDAAGSGA